MFLPIVIDIIYWLLSSFISFISFFLSFCLSVFLSFFPSFLLLQSMFDFLFCRDIWTCEEYFPRLSMHFFASLPQSGNQTTKALAIKMLSQKLPGFYLLFPIPWFDSQLSCSYPSLYFGAGPNFIHPPHPWKYLSRGGGRMKGGGYKIPAAWALKIYTPTPLPWKMPLGQKWGRGGGGVYNFSLDLFWRRAFVFRGCTTCLTCIICIGFQAHVAFRGQSEQKAKHTNGSCVARTLRTFCMLFFLFLCLPSPSQKAQYARN